MYPTLTMKKRGQYFFLIIALFTYYLFFSYSNTKRDKTVEFTAKTILID